MRILIVGAGEVGSSIAANLAGSHEVVVVERNQEVVEELTYSLDVLAIQGDGTDLGVLQQAEIDRADMVIAATDSDETNIVISGTAKTISDAFTVARIKRRSLLTTWEQAHGAFGVDFMVCTDLVTAEAIFRISEVPHAHDVDSFSNDLVRMVELKVGPDSPIVGKSVSEADQYDSMTFAGIFRDDELIVVTGETTIEAGDNIVVIGGQQSVRSFASETATEPDEDIEIHFTGLRQGEKLYEELITEGEDVMPTAHEKIMVLQQNGHWNGHDTQEAYKAFLLNQVYDLYTAAALHDTCGIREKMTAIVPEFKVQDSQCVL